ncbi:MAG: carbamoyltransferase [Nitrospirae bacterium]|nr:carbamoyltransferase [Nitrospirota bacterium]
MGNKPVNILGISCFYHDSAAALICDGEIIAAAQEERFTRKKHDPDFPKHAITYCLKEGNVAVNELDYVAFYDKPFIKFERIVETYLAYAPRGLRSFLMAVPLWLKDKLWMSKLIMDELGGYQGDIIFPEHHESHAASAFYPSPFEEAAFLTIDGVGEWTTTSFGVGKGNLIEMQYELQFPHSIGLLYSAFTYYAGFKVNSGEYKVMGLAPYGEPKYANLIYEHLMDLKEDGSFKLNMDYFNYCAGLTMTNEKFHELFGGPPRKPETLLTQREMDLAASLQEVTEDIMLRMAKHVKKETGQRYLCLAGGVALNCVGNGKILRSNIFDDLWIQPAAGDAGGALGAALFTWHQYLGNNRNTGNREKQKGSYLGPEFSNEYIEIFLTKNGIPLKKYESSELPEVVAGLLMQGKVIGWFYGRMEFGPRALGSRSIIGDAMSPEMQSKMNLKIKFRESFRPFAPSILAENVSEWFDIDRESPYMLLVANVRKDKQRSISEDEKRLWGIDKLNVIRSDIPAVTHVDYSARIQTVNREDNSMYYDVIRRFYEKTDCPMIINTSFNVRGEPIVCTPEDAYKCFMRTNMDYLVLGDFVLDKAVQPEFTDDRDWKKEYELD